MLQDCRCGLMSRYLALGSCWCNRCYQKPWLLWNLQVVEWGPRGSSWFLIGLTSSQNSQLADSSWIDLPAIENLLKVTNRTNTLNYIPFKGEAFFYLSSQSCCFYNKVIYIIFITNLAPIWSIMYYLMYSSFYLQFSSIVLIYHNYLSI